MLYILRVLLLLLSGLILGSWLICLLFKGSDSVRHFQFTLPYCDFVSLPISIFLNFAMASVKLSSNSFQIRFDSCVGSYKHKSPCDIFSPPLSCLLFFSLSPLSRSLPHSNSNCDVGIISLYLCSEWLCDISFKDSKVNRLQADMTF